MSELSIGSTAGATSLSTTYGQGRISNPPAVNDIAAFEQAMAAKSQRALLKEGARGEDVAKLQQELNSLGYDAGPVDGIFGPQTNQAVRTLQADNGLVVDGIAGPQTFAALETLNESTAVLKNGVRGPEVSALQRNLAHLGYDVGAVDGIFGDRTEQAVRQFQEANNLTVDGIVGVQTKEALHSATPSGPVTSQPPPVAGTTWDSVTNQNIAELHPAIRASTAEFVNEVETQLGIQLRVSSGYRSFAEQDALYAQGRTSPGQRVTNAQGGESYHNYGLAVDVVEIDNNGQANWDTDWEAIAAIGKDMGFEWGGDWTSIIDKPHFQQTYGMSTSELLQLYNSGQRNGPYVNIP